MNLDNGDGFSRRADGGVFLSVSVRPDYPSPRQAAVSAQIEHIRRTGQRPNRRH